MHPKVNIGAIFTLCFSIFKTKKDIFLLSKKTLTGCLALWALYNNKNDYDCIKIYNVILNLYNTTILLHNTLKLEKDILIKNYLHMYHLF